MARQLLTVGLLSPLVRGGGHSRVVAGGVQGGARWAREVNTGAEAEREAIVWCDGPGDGRCGAAEGGRGAE